MSCPGGVRSGWAAAREPDLSLAGTALDLRLSLWLRRRFVRCRRFFTSHSIAVLSREMCPTKRSACVSRISASCNRGGKALVANSAKARENVASLGTSPLRCQPHNQRNVLSTDNISISSRVVDKLNTAFATKARANAERSDNGRPREARPAGKERLDPGHTKNADQLLVVFVQRATGRVVQPGQEFFLNMEPVSG